jgi:hypothetical protein
MTMRTVNGAESRQLILAPAVAAQLGEKAQVQFLLNSTENDEHDLLIQVQTGRRAEDRQGDFDDIRSEARACTGGRVLGLHGGRVPLNHASLGVCLTRNLLATTTSNLTHHSQVFCE